MRKSPYFEELEKRLKKVKSNLRINYPEIFKNKYPKELKKIIEKHIEVYGHAYCMDVPGERRKIAKLVYELLTELSRDNQN